MASFTLHPDNSRFAFSVDDVSKSELWVMENFLPPTKVKGQAFGALPCIFFLSTVIQTLGEAFS